MIDLATCWIVICSALDARTELNANHEELGWQSRYNLTIEIVVDRDKVF